MGAIGIAWAFNDEVISGIFFAGMGRLQFFF
jgi:hypothetical protein